MDLLADLNEPQRQAVRQVDGPLLVLAGAGSGKTRVITRRVAWLVRQGVSPRSILAITFTNKAAGEMQDRVRRLDTPPGATICTFHSFCARMLREHAEQAGMRRNFSIYDTGDQLKLLKDSMAAVNLKTGNLPPARAHWLISRAKNALQTPDALAAEAGDLVGRTLAKVYEAYQQALAANNAADFDDLLLRVAMLLRDRPDVRQALGQRYRYVLVDEYQDTNHAQYLIAHGIAMDHENIAVTGDPDQSIYAWRGADINNILEFESDYPNAKVIRLEENYRSTRPILTAASRLISHNRQRKDKALWTRRAGGRDVTVAFCDDQKAEAERVARGIEALKSAGGAYGDAAVFYRVNSLSRVVEQVFIRSGIPYRVARGVEFYNRKEVKDVLAYLRLLVNPSDDVSCQRAINTPARGIGAATISRLAEMARAEGIGLLAACAKAAGAGLGKSAAEKAERFAALMKELAAETDQPVRRIMEDVLGKTGLEESLNAAEETEDARANVGELISTAAEFDANAPPDAAGLADYLCQVSLASDVDHMGGGNGAVTLMTLHAAKGLEFPAVFMIGCEDGLLPFKRERDPAAERPESAARQVEEERRLAFVGMTRAMEHLTLTCARHRIVRGVTVAQAASPFLKEIGSQNVKVEDLTTPRPAPSPSSGATAGGFYADVRERALIESAERDLSLPPGYEYIKAGSLIRHPKFGLGKVLSLSQPWPETRATVHFDQWGTKKLVLAMANVELVTRE